MNKVQGKEKLLWVGALLLTMAYSPVADAHACASMWDADALDRSLVTDANTALAKSDRQKSEALSDAARMLEQPAMTWDKWIAQEAKKSFSQRGPRRVAASLVSEDAEIRPAMRYDWPADTSVNTTLAVRTAERCQ